MRRHLARIATATAVAALAGSMLAGTALGGEITGNGQLKDVNGKSECAFSGQEDLQWYFDDANTMPKPQATRGNPGHAQSWGQIPKPVRDFIAVAFNAHPGEACNPHKVGAE